MKRKPYQPVHPGVVIKKEITARGKTIQEVADILKISRKNFSLLLNGHSRLEAQMALKISKLLGPAPLFWINLQGQYDVYHLDESKVKIKPLPKIKLTFTRQ